MSATPAARCAARPRSPASATFGCGEAPGFTDMELLARSRARSGCRRRPDDARHRRPVHRQRQLGDVADAGGRVPRHPAELHRRHDARRLELHRPPAAGDAGAAVGPVQCGAGLLRQHPAHGDLRPPRDRRQPPLPRPAALRDTVRADDAGGSLCAGRRRATCTSSAPRGASSPRWRWPRAPGRS